MWNRLPSVSIIIPTRNRSGSLKRCLDTLVDQSYPGGDVEVVIADDASEDDTPSATAALKPSFHAGRKSLTYLRPSTRGINSALNAGIRSARGEVIVTIGDDTLAPAGWLAALVQGLVESGKDATSGPLRIDRAGPIVGRHREEVSALLTEVSEPVFLPGGGIVPVSGNMAVWKRTFARGMFDESIRPPVEEIDWVLRAGVSASFTPEAWVWHDKSEDEMKLKSLLRKAWLRGGEDGRWRRRRRIPASSNLARLALSAFYGTARSLGHAVLAGCSGGVLTATSQLARGLALLGWIDHERGL